jgi:hypothetical protein
MKVEAGYLRMGRAPLPRLEVPAIRVLQISGLLFVAEAACQVDERLFLPERLSRVGSCSPGQGRRVISGSLNVVLRC